MAVAADALPKAPTATSGTQGDATLRQLPLERIAPGRFQPRKAFAQDQIDALAASIRTAGVMQPILVREALAMHQGLADFELIAGERRWRAAKVAGLSTIPAIIVKLSDVEAAEWGLIENLQREDLGTMERATALASLARQFALTHAQVAERVGLDRSTVTNFIRLTELEPAIQGLIDAKRLTAGHGKALLGAPAGASRVALAERAALGAWSVRRLEHAATELTADGSSPTPVLVAASADELITSRARDLTLREIERRLQEHLGTKATIKTDRSGTRGRVVLRFYGLDQFEGLLSKMGIPKSP